jgi:hypothetical protein
MGWFVGIVAYLLLGLAVARVAYHHGLYSDDDPELNIVTTVALLTCGPAVVVFLGPLAAVGYGAYRLVTMPTAAQRRQRRETERAEERRQVEAEARRLGLPLLEEDRHG